jgi:hypothetical protein
VGGQIGNPGYDVPAGMPLKLHFRGFEQDEAIVEIRK